MNHFSFYGRISQDIELRQTSGDKPLSIANFSIAVNRKGKDAGADFFRLTVFGKPADIIHQYFGKGSRIAVSGHVQNNSYTDKDGKKRTQTQFIVDDFDFVDTKAESQAPSSVPKMPQMSAPPAPDNFMSIPDSIDEELPFH